MCGGIFLKPVLVWRMRKHTLDPAYVCWYFLILLFNSQPISRQTEEEGWINNFLKHTLTWRMRIKSLDPASISFTIQPIGESIGCWNVRMWESNGFPELGKVSRILLNPGQMCVAFQRIWDTKCQIWQWKCAKPVFCLCQMVLVPQHGQWDLFLNNPHWRKYFLSLSVDFPGIFQNTSQ